MNSKKFSEAMNEIDDKYIEKAANYQSKKRKPVWIKWGAVAACFVVAFAGIAISQFPDISSNPGSGVSPGGNHPDGVDPVIASVAVFPATEKLENVADAAIESLTEADAYGFDTLSEYLPTSLPDGYHFENASLYETTMKDSTQYYMLRVQYSMSGDTVQGNADAADAPNFSGSSFVVFVMNYKPRTEKQIFEPDDITESRLAEIGGSTFHLSYGNVHVGISPNTAATNDILTAIASIG